MFRQSDDRSSERPRGGARVGRSGRYDERPRQQPKSDYRDNARNLDKDWVHDRFEDDRYSQEDTRSRRPRRNDPEERFDTRDDSLTPKNGARLRVDNLHYDLTEQDLKELFTRIGPVHTVSILYDRSDRSRGTGFVTYASARDAEDAIREFDGANAYGQPIKLTLMPSGPGTRALASRVEPAGRSLFDRIENGHTNYRTTRRGRSESPQRDRRAEVLLEGTPDGIDRYVPENTRLRQARSRSPVASGNRRPPQNTISSGPRRDERRGSGRGRARSGRDTEGRLVVGGRPRKTAQELDAEMADYWGSGTGENSAPAAAPSSAPTGLATKNVAMNEASVTPGTTATPITAPEPILNPDDDIDMIE